MLNWQGLKAFMCARNAGWGLTGQDQVSKDNYFSFPFSTFNSTFLIWKFVERSQFMMHISIFLFVVLPSTFIVIDCICCLPFRTGSSACIQCPAGTFSNALGLYACAAK